MAKGEHYQETFRAIKMAAIQNTPNKGYQQSNLLKKKQLLSSSLERASEFLIWTERSLPVSFISPLFEWEQNLAEQ